MPRPVHPSPCHRTGLSVLLAMLALAGCAGPSETFILKPDKDGNIGSMRAVAKDGQTFTLDAQRSAAQARGGKVAAATPDEASTKVMFREVLEAQPLPPTSFRLYFVEGGDQLTAESQVQFDAVIEEIKRRPLPDLVVVGHTDRVGSVESNDRLALRRAESIQRLLERRGIATDSISTSGRGEREPLVDTADEVAEPRNRRVEILVR